MSDFAGQVFSVRERLTLKYGAYPVEVWFIDRPDEYERFVDESEALEVVGPQGWPLSRVKVFNVLSSYVVGLPENRRLAARVFQGMPGIWCLLSDGTVESVTHQWLTRPGRPASHARIMGCSACGEDHDDVAVSRSLDSDDAQDASFICPATGQVVYVKYADVGHGETV